MTIKFVKFSSLVYTCCLCYVVNGHSSGDVHQVTLSCGGDTHPGRVSPGPPGNRGPMGPVGPDGQKGDRGNPGSCTETCNNMEERLRVLEKQKTDLYKTCQSIVYHFPTMAHTSHVRYLPRFPQITKATLCAWVRDAEDTRSTSHIASYATTRTDNDLLWAVRRRVTLMYTHNAVVEMRIVFPRRTWTHICTWIDAATNRAGTYQNGTFTEQKVFPFDPVPGGEFDTRGGVFMIGQDQDRVGGGFQESDTFWGSIANLMIWPRVLSASEIHDIAHNCVCPGDYSVSLTPDKVEMVGNVDYKFSKTCPVV